MQLNVRSALSLALLFGLSACVNQPNVDYIDLTKQQGVYLVAYSTDASARLEFEAELQANLLTGGLLAFASHEDIDDITQSDANEVFLNAKRHGVVAIVVINNAEDTTVENPDRLRLDTPGVREHFERIRSTSDAVPGRDVILEVNAFAIDGNTAKLAWSGVTAVFEPESRTAAIEELSNGIADALRIAQQQLRSGS